MKKKKKKKLRQYPRCWRTNKIAYPDEDTAYAGVRAMFALKTNFDINNTNVYQCRFCNKWHNGRKSKHKEYLRRHNDSSINV